MFHTESLSARLLFSCVSSKGIRSLNTTAHVCGRKSRDPYDRRFGIHLHDALPGKPGATKELYEELSRARTNIVFVIAVKVCSFGNPHDNVAVVATGKDCTI